MVSVIMCFDDQAVTSEEARANRSDAVGQQAARTPGRIPAERQEYKVGRMEGSGTQHWVKPSHVFICCKQTDIYARDIISKLAAALGGAQSVFYDRADVAGLPWARQLEAALRDSDVVVAVLSQHSIDSEMVEAELRVAR